MFLLRRGFFRACSFFDVHNQLLLGFVLVNGSSRIVNLIFIETCLPCPVATTKPEWTDRTCEYESVLSGAHVHSLRIAQRNDLRNKIVSPQWRSSGHCDQPNMEGRCTRVNLRRFVPNVLVQALLETGLIPTPFENLVPGMRTDKIPFYSHRELRSPYNLQSTTRPMD